MRPFQEDVLNDLIINRGEIFKINTSPKNLKDKKDAMVRAVLLNTDVYVKLKGVATSLRDGNKVKLIDGYVITSNGRVMEPDKFNKLYQPASKLIGIFINKKSELINNEELSIKPTNRQKDTNEFKEKTSFKKKLT